VPGVLMLSGCMDPTQIRTEQCVDEQKKCSDFGYAKGPDGFAHGMMDVSRIATTPAARQDREAHRKELALR